MIGGNLDCCSTGCASGCMGWEGWVGWEGWEGSVGWGRAMLGG